MKILLAEDDPSIQMVAKLTLQKVGGHEVITAENGQEAYEKAQQLEGVDLILLDGMMPVVDGLECCRLLKQNPQTQSIPVIFLTARNQQSDLDEAISAGAIGYIVKPFDAKELCNEILKIYNKHLWSQSA